MPAMGSTPIKLTGRHADAAPALLLQEKWSSEGVDCPFALLWGSSPCIATCPRLHSPLGEVLLWHFHLFCFINSSG